MKAKHFVLGMVTTLSLHANGSVLGKYKLDVTIYGKKYIDILEIKEISNSGNDPGISIIKGFFEVPNNFRSPFEGTLQKNKLRLKFIAEEGDEPFEVLLRADVLEDETLEGELLNAGTRFGFFTGVRNESNH
ncbi:MAG: hypothetical protein EP326_11550 [Deltaproteobacteria bacterium]|nr:MAG: hypothetical protein EP326_11550 [Deltaproteobacteria bacterium]